MQYEGKSKYFIELLKCIVSPFIILTLATVLVDVIPHLISAYLD